MKIGELIADKNLAEKGILQKLICGFCGISKEEMRTKSDQEIDENIFNQIQSAYNIYIEKKKPLEYLLGYVEFFGRRFVVNEATLIPRPETEYMINSVSEFISWKLKAESWKPKNNIPEFISMKHESWDIKQNLLLDIWTGCGVLGLSILLQNPDFFDEAILTDFYQDALEVAKENFRNYKWEIINDPEVSRTSKLKEVEIIQSDLLEFLINDKWEIINEKLKKDNIWSIVLVANLPYIPEKTFDEWVGENVKNWEPRPAFVGWEDGLDYYRKMFEQIIKNNLELGIRNEELRNENKLVMFLEMMTWQVDILRKEFWKKMEFEEVKTFHFNIRIVKAWLK